MNWGFPWKVRCLGVEAWADGLGLRVSGFQGFGGWGFQALGLAGFEGSSSNAISN